MSHLVNRNETNRLATTKRVAYTLGASGGKRVMNDEDMCDALCDAL